LLSERRLVRDPVEDILDLERLRPADTVRMSASLAVRVDATTPIGEVCSASSVAYPAAKTKK
jgi:hypothetical protein